MEETPYPWSVRDATERDADMIAEFNQLLAVESEGKHLDADVLGRGVRSLLTHPEYGRYFLAEVEGDVIGQLMITFEWSDWRCGMFWWLQSVYVVPDYRRRGVFRSLFRHVESAARLSGGVCGIRLYVERENQIALSTYQELGLHPAGYHVYEADWTDVVRKA